MDEINRILAEKLKNYFHKGNNLGPTLMDEVTDADVRRAIFEYHSRVYERGAGDPSLIIGRRGAGKTAYLQYLEDSGKYNVVVRLKKDEAMSEIIREIGLASKDVAHVEQVSKLWIGLLYISVLAQINRNHKHLIENDADLLRLRTELGLNESDSPINQIRSVLARAAARQNEGLIANIINLLDSIFAAKKAPVEFLEEKIHGICKANKLKILISIDSLEEYDFSQHKRDLAIKGFLKAVGTANNVRNGLRVRCCIPSETYVHLLEISANPDKDFPSSMTLHWRANELMSLVSHRMWIHMSLYGDAEPNRVRRALAANIKSEQGVREFLCSAICAEVKNENGWLEPPLFFLLRHTQMLPRQALMLMDEAMLLLSQSTGRKYFDFSERILRTSIINRAKEMRSGIVNAFRYVHGDIEDLVSTATSYLPVIFKESDMDKVHGQRLRKLSSGANRASSEVLDILIRIGCVGRVLETTDRYVRGVFEYNARVPPRSTSDQYCVHPLFKCEQNFFAVDSERTLPVVHPIGTDPNDNEHSALR